MLEGLSKTYKKMFSKVPNKKNKRLKITADNEKFFRVVDNIYYLPPEVYIRKNLDQLRILDETFQTYYNEDREINEDWLEINEHYFDTEIETIRFINWLRENQKEIAVDIESTGLSYYNDELLLIVFSWGWNEVGIIDKFTTPVLKSLQLLFAKEDIKFIWHNGKFDVGRLRTFKDINARIDEDTMLLHYIGYNENRGTHGLGYLAMLYLNAPNWEKDLDVIKKQVCRDKKIKQADFDYGMFPKEDLISYAYYDGIATYRLYKVFKSGLPKHAEFIYYKLIEASNIFSDIEAYGVNVSLETINELNKHLTTEYKEITENIKNLTENIWNPERYKLETGAKSASENFNPNSPKQVKWIFEEQGFSLPDTSASTLEEINHVLAKEMLRLRKNNKYRKTYVQGLKNSIDGDGKIHTTYNLHGTATGRLSSSNPNLQNIPRSKEIKDIFVASKGNILIQADYSQAELRVMAVLSDDEWLKDVYKRGEDLHDAVAKQYWGENYSQEDRVKAKAVNFGIAYGRTANTLAPSLNIEHAEAEKLLTDWFKPMPMVKKFFNDKVSSALRGEPAITIFGRTRRFIVTSTNKFSIRNEAMNTPIQATASDLTLFSLIEIHKELLAKKLGRVILTVHDSIIVETKKENLEEVSEIMVKHMKRVPEKYLDTDVPFKADIDYGERWGDLS